MPPELDDVVFPPPFAPAAAPANCPAEVISESPAEAEGLILCC